MYGILNWSQFFTEKMFSVGARLHLAFAILSFDVQQFLQITSVKLWRRVLPLWWSAVKTTKYSSAFKAGLFLLSCEWLAKCLVLAAAQFSLFCACAVT